MFGGAVFPLYPVYAAVVKYVMWRACPVPLFPVDAAVVKYVLWRAVLYMLLL